MIAAVCVAAGASLVNAVGGNVLVVGGVMRACRGCVCRLRCAMAVVWLGCRCDDDDHVVALSVAVYVVWAMTTMTTTRRWRMAGCK